MDSRDSKEEENDDILLEPKSLKSRMYLTQLQSYSKHKKAKMSYTPSTDSLSASHVIRSLRGGEPSTSTTTTSGKTSGDGTSKRVSTSHGERFCSPRYAVSPPATADEAYMRELQESWKSDPTAAHSSRSLVVSPLGRPESASRRKHTPTYHENWKRKRGKFALAEKQKPPDYQWIPFLGIAQRSRERIDNNPLCLALAYLLKRQPNTMEFIYLQPPKIPKTPEFDPYELEVVTYGQIDSPYYYTISSQGVTLFRDGDAEFTPLDQWERGYRSYKCIINLNVFRQYKYWKSWKVWKHVVRRKKKKISTELLLKLLFTCNVIFAAVLLHIRAMCSSLWTVRFLQLDVGEVYTLERFMSVQESRKEQNARILLELTNKAVEALRESCIKALSKLEEDLLGRRKDEPKDGTMKEVIEKDDGKEKSRGNKLVGVAARWKAQKERDSEEKESQERYTYLIAAAKRSEQVRLQNCVRLTDYLISDALREVLLSTLRDLLLRVAHKPPPVPETRQSVTLAAEAENANSPTSTEKVKEKEKIEEQPKRRLSRRGSSFRRSVAKRESTLLMNTEEEKKLDRLQVFEVDLAMTEDQLLLVPSYSEFEKNIEIWIKGMMDVVRSLRRLLYHPVLDGVVDKGDSSIDNLATYLDLIGEAQFGGLIASIKTSISLAYKDADKNKVTFITYVDNAIKSKCITQPRMRDEIKARTRDLAVFKEDIVRYRSEIKEIEAAPNSADIGILHINYVKLKETLLPFPRQALQNIYQLLPKLASEHYEVFINEIHMSEKKMGVKPSTVEEFVDIANFAEISRKRWFWIT
ncbi:hypothetical protein R1flu_028094 [Riccia fluitans]|uniref:Uncharacterized protein n=1 Tax=Riccia fluitans TaxID=41844 RepID=A0ABD1XNM6_9MARC